MRCLVLVLGLGHFLFAPASSADATLTRQSGAPDLFVDGVGVPVGAPFAVKPGPHQVRVGTGDGALEGAVFLQEHPYVFRRNPCSGFELIDKSDASTANKSVTLVARAPTPATVNASAFVVDGAGFAEAPVSANCPGAPVFVTAHDQTRVALLAPGQHAVVVVDAAAGPEIEIVAAPPALRAVCSAAVRIAVVENPPPATLAPARTPGMRWVLLLRAAGCDVVRGPKAARQVRTENTLFTRAGAPALAAAVHAAEAQLDWPSDVDVVFAVATAPTSAGP